MALPDTEMEVLRRLVAAEEAGRQVSEAFEEAVEELGLHSHSVTVNLTKAGAVQTGGAAWQGGAQDAEVISVTEQGREMVRRRV